MLVMPKGCILSLLGSFLVIFSSMIFFMEYSVDYSKIELSSLFEDFAYLETICYLVLSIGLFFLIFGLVKIFTGSQEEPDSNRGGIVSGQYSNNQENNYNG